jgi:hypothetical protein
MSKSLLNNLVQISKALVYSKIKFYSEKNFSVAFGPSGLSAEPRPIFFSFPPAFFFFPPSPLGLGLSAGPSCSQPAQSACASVAPHPIAAFLTGKRLQPRHLRPSPHPAHHPAPHLGMPPKPLSPHHHSPLIPPLNLAPTFNGVKAINATVTPVTPPRCSPPATPLHADPYKSPPEDPGTSRPSPGSPLLPFSPT